MVDQVIWEELDDTKGAIIRIRKSKDGQHNGTTKKDKSTYNDLQNIAHNTKDWVTLKTGGELCIYVDECVGQKYYVIFN